MADKKYLKLNDLSAYKIAFHLSNYLWKIAVKWDYFAKDTVGKQYIKAVDSVSACIAEGFGRYTKKDRIHFFRIAFGSLKESQDWTEKARIRKLLTQEQYDFIMQELQKLPLELNSLIKYTNEKLAI